MSQKSKDEVEIENIKKRYKTEEGFFKSRRHYSNNASGRAGDRIKKIMERSESPRGRLPLKDLNMKTTY